MDPLSNYHSAREKARQQYDAAFHLLNVTFPLAKDPQLLMGVVNNLLSSLEHSLTAILAYERQLRLVPPYFDNFQSKFNLFRLKSVQRNKISPDYVNLILDLKEILELHKRSPLEFQRGNRFVICTKDFQLKAISIKDLQEYLTKTKEFLALSEKIIKIK